MSGRQEKALLHSLFFGEGRFLLTSAQVAHGLWRRSITHPGAWVCCPQEIDRIATMKLPHKIARPASEIWRGNRPFSYDFSRDYFLSWGSGMMSGSFRGRQTISWYNRNRHNSRSFWGEDDVSSWYSYGGRGSHRYISNSERCWVIGR